MKKRIIALLLVCLMVVSVVPAWAGAEEAPAATSEAAACPGKGATHTLENCPDAEVVSEQKEPTCVDWGWAVYRCPVCEDVFADEFGAPTGAHTWVETTPKKDATCTESGTEAVYTCSVCEATTGGDTISPLGHAWEEKEITGNCLRGGTVKKSCTRCGATITEQYGIGRNGHTWDSVPTELTAPTCTQEGSATYTCLICGETTKVPVLTVAHNFVKHEQKDATCTAAGYKAYYQCADCGLIVDGDFDNETYGEHCLENDGVERSVYEAEIKAHTTDLTKLAIKKLDHKGTGENAPTCMKPGKCDVCGATIPATGHTFEKDANGNYINPKNTVDPKCEEAGYYEYWCTKCNGTEDGGKVRVAIPAKGHVSYEDSKDPTKGWIVAHECGKVGGTRAWKCDDCGKLLTESPDKDHKLVTVVVPATDCQTAGYTYTYCAYKIDTEGEHKNDVLCDVAAVTEYKTKTPDGKTDTTVKLKDENGEELTEPRRVVSFTWGKALDHQATQQPPTCTEDGKCDWCDKVFPATGHDWDKKAGKLPTCTEKGKEATWTCKNCGELHDVWNGSDIDALGHRHGTKVEAKDATCTEPGNVEYYVCTVCGKPCTANDEDVQSTTIPALGHDYVADGEPVEPTCTTAGYVKKVCSRCGDEVVDCYAAPLGHEWVKDSENSKDATCEADGVFAEKCTRCDSVRTTVLPATGHKNAEGDVLIDDCRNHVTVVNGEEDRTCVNCEEKIGQTHNKLKETTVERTCKQDGYHLIVCENCNEVLVEEIELAPTDGSHLDPDFGVKWTAESKETCEKGGTYYSVCQVCGERKEKTEPATGHKWDDNGWTDVEGQEATHTHGGKQERSCLNGCGEKQTRDTASIPGFDYVLSADNAVVSGAGYADSSLVAVTVSLKSAGIDVRALGFRLNYDKDVVKFEKAEFAENTVFVANQNANDNDGYVVVTGFTANSGKVPTNANITDETVVTLYFRIISADATGTSFSVSNSDASSVTEKGTTSEVDATLDEISIEIQAFLDGDNDGEFSLRDVEYAEMILLGQPINDEIVEYDVTVDIDKDGVITVADIQAMLDYYVGRITYEELVAMGVAAE